MTDTFTLLGTTFNNVAGFRAKDSGGTVQTFEQSYTLVDTTTVNVSTTSTTATSVATWEVNTTGISAGSFFLFRVRDTAGARDGYFYGSDAYFFPDRVFNGLTGAISNGGRVIISRTDAGAWYNYAQGTNAGYGVYVRQFNCNKISGTDLYKPTVFIYSRYNSTYSRTIDGTYAVEFYELKGPDGTAP